MRRRSRDVRSNPPDGRRRAAPRAAWVLASRYNCHCQMQPSRASGGAALALALAVTATGSQANTQPQRAPAPQAAVAVGTECARARCRQLLLRKSTASLVTSSPLALGKSCARLLRVGGAPHARVRTYSTYEARRGGAGQCQWEWAGRSLPTPTALRANASLQAWLPVHYAL